MLDLAKAEVPVHIVSVINDICLEVGVTAITMDLRGQFKQIKLELTIDALQGIMHEQCVAVSRGMNEKLETDEWYNSLMAVEVSSPGAETPVRFLWQLEKHVGRVVRVTQINGDISEGVLVSIDSEKIVLRLPKKKTDNTIEIAATGVAEARVVIKI